MPLRKYKKIEDGLKIDCVTLMMMICYEKT